MTIEHHPVTQSTQQTVQQFIAARSALLAGANKDRKGRNPEWPRMTEREIHDLIRDTLG